MQMIENNIKNINEEKGYSKDYYLIRNEVENSWPSWKAETYNLNFATSKHAKKIKLNDSI